MAKIHWPRTDQRSLCGQPLLNFTGNGQDVTCERCKKLLPEVRRTAWDLLNDEGPPAPPEKPKRVRKPRAKPVDRTNSMTESFKIAYGVEPAGESQKPLPVTLFVQDRLRLEERASREAVQYRVRIPWQAWSFLGALIAMAVARWWFK